MAKVKLTDAERLIIANQHEILSLLKNDDWHARVAKNFMDGHKWIYEQHLNGLSENLPDDAAEYVLSVLGLYSILRDSFAELSDKSGIDERLVTFPGFDGNNESELLSFAQALSDNGNYTHTIGEKAKNSHMPTTDIYSRMLGEWKRIGKSDYPLSKESIAAILEARHRS